jgi:hypothetical protein
VFDQKFLEKDCVTILGMKQKYLDERANLFHLAHGVDRTSGANAFLMNSLDYLTTAADILDPDEEEDSLDTANTDHVALASKH